MPIYRVQAPDGKIYRVQGPDGASNEQVIAAVIQQHPDAGQAPSTITDIGRGVVRGLGSTVGGFAKPIEDIAGKNSVSDWLREAGQDITGTVAPRTTPNLAEAWDKEGVLGALKSAAVTVSEGSIPTIGGIATGLVTKSPAAAMAVMGATGAPATYTGIREQQAQEGIDNKASAVLGTAASTALDVLTGGGRAVSNIGREAILDLFENGMRKAAKEVVRTGAEESATESIQNVIEQVAGGADPTTKASLQQTLEAGVAGLVGGTFFGGVSEGTNSIMAGRRNRAVSDISPIHSVNVLRPGEENPDTIDILSAPSPDGVVVARGPNGKVFNTSLDALEELRADKGVEGAVPIADTLRAAALMREPSLVDDAVARIVSNPEDKAAFDALVERYTTLYGVPEEQAKQLALGAFRTQTTAETVAETEIAAPVASEPTPEAAALTAPETAAPETAAPVAPEPTPEAAAPTAPEPTPALEMAAPTAPEPTPALEMAAPEAPIEELVPVEAPAEEAPIEEPSTPVTVLPAGTARGVKPVQRGTQGTQRGRPVEGAAQLTEGMRAQQALVNDLQAARDAREISDAEVAETTDMLRPPTSERALKALPIEQRNQWVNAIDAQRQVDQLQERINQVPKEVLGRPNPERIDLEETMRKLQKRLDEAQQDIVNRARERFETARRERAERIKMIRKVLREGNLSEADRRELLIGLRENTVQRAQQGESVTDDPRSPEQVEEELRGKDAHEVVQWLVDTAPNQAMRVIARGVQRTINRLSDMGIKFEYYNVDVDSFPSIPMDALNSLDTIANALTDFHYGTNTITVWANGADQGPFSGMSYGVMLHEFVHAATSPLLDYAEAKPNTTVGRLGRDLKDVLSAVRTHAQQNIDGVNPPSGNVFDDEHELLAWTLSDPRVMEYLDTVPYQGNKSIFQRLVEVVRSILGLSANYDTALGEVLRIGDALFNVGEKRTAEAIQSAPTRTAPVTRAIKKSKQATPQQKINKGLFKAQMASQAAGFLDGLDEAAAGARLEGKEKLQAATEAFGSRTTPVTAELQPTSWLEENIERMRPALGSILKGINKLDQNMRGMRNSMNKAMRRRVKEVERFTNKYGQGALSQMMTIARVNRVNPAEFKTRQEALQSDPVLQYYTNKNSTGGIRARTEEINTAWDAWERLGKQEGGHETYLRMRDFYKDMYDALRAAQDQEIRNLGLDKAATDRLIAAARGDLEEGEVEDGEKHAGVPEALFPKEYFPFRRFGEYVLIVKRGKRSERERYHFESAYERNKFKITRAKQLGLVRGTDAYDAAFEQFDGLRSMRENLDNDSFLLKRLFEAVDGIKEPTGAESTGKFKESLKDRLYQTYLMTLPERSLRKQFIHADLVTGQSADVLRVFKVAAAQYASQLPKVMYGSQIQTQIEAAYDTANEGDPTERAKLRTLLNVYAGRVRDTMSPEPRHWLEQRINELTFVSLMTSVASAVVQPLTLPFQVMPRLISRYGFEGAMKTLTMYTPLFNISKITVDEDPATGEKWFVAPSIGNTDFIKNNPLRARLWQELDVKRDLFSQKHADMILRNRPSRSTVGNTALTKAVSGYEDIVNVSGALFSSADQLAREMAGMSYAELEYQKLRKEGKNHEEAIAGAIDAAVQNTNETIGNYTELEKPGIFRGNALKRMIGFLRTYSAQRTAYYFRMLGAIMKGAPTQTRLQAIGELSMVLAFTAAGAGVSANFGYSFTCELIDLILAATMSDDDKDEWRRQDPLGADDADYRFRFEWLPKNFGPDSTVTRILQRGALSAITGWDFSTRLSQNELWLRSFQKGDSTRENVLNFLTANLAPQVSQSATILDGIDLFSQGDWSKGFGKLMPAAIRGLFNAERFATEGETTKSGQVVMGAGEFSTPALVGQVLGFTPTELARKREINRTTQAYQRAMEKERGNLFIEYRKVLMDDASTRDDIDVVLEKMRRYNSKIPLDSNGQPLSRFRIDPQDVIKSLVSTSKRVSKSYRGTEYAPGEGTNYFPYEKREPVRP